MFLSEIIFRKENLFLLGYPCDMLIFEAASARQESFQKPFGEQ
jgi:hypothetical protein